MELDLSALDKTEEPVKVGFSPITVHKYIIEFAIYPNGKVYPKMYPIGQSVKQFKDKRKKENARLESSQSTDEVALL